jgi:pimeloyl-ACP methyl ester carboxylesterase
MQIEKVTIKSSDNLILEGFVYSPSEKNKTIIFFHGYGATKEHYRNLLQKISTSVKTVIFDIRGHGNSGDAFDVEKAADDAALIIEKYAGPDTKIIMHSTGFLIFLLAYYKLKAKKSKTLKFITGCYALSPLLSLNNLAPYASLSAGLLSKLSEKTNKSIDDIACQLRLDKLGFLPKRPIEAALALKGYDVKTYGKVNLPLLLFLPKNDLILGLFNKKQRELYSDTIRRIFSDLTVDESLSVNHNYRLIGNIPFGDKKTLDHIAKKIIF